MAATLRRVLKEKKMIHADEKELHEMGIYVQWGDDLNHVKAMIIGPHGTPYEHGFFFFDITFPKQYPLQPPAVKFCTNDGRVRFNPNLYEQGKVCLSIINTWDGPPWQATLTLRTVLLSIQSLLNAHPIQNEPGFEHEHDSPNDTLYKEILGYETIHVAVLRMLEHTPEGFDVFHGPMRDIFLTHYDSYCAKLKDHYVGKGSTGYVNSPIWGFSTEYRADDLLKKLEGMKEKLGNDALVKSPAGCGTEPDAEP